MDPWSLHKIATAMQQWNVPLTQVSVELHVGTSHKISWANFLVDPTRPRKM